LGPFLAIIAALGFAGKAIFIKLVYAASPTMDAVTLLALRMLYALPFFAVLYWAGTRQPGAEPLETRDFGAMAILGFLGYYLASFFDFWGLQFISAALERLILFTYPAWILIFSSVVFRQHIKARQGVALLISGSGLALAFLADIHVNRDALIKGSALVLLSSLIYAGFLIGSSRIVGRAGSLRFASVSVTFSALFVFAHFLATHPARTLIDQSAHVHWLSFLLGLIATALPIWWTAEAIRRIGPGRVGIIGTVGPIATIWLGHWTVGEPVTMLQIVGAVLVLVGVTLVSLGNPQQAIQTVAAELQD
jgi:drug/metabolite transporter (DMT)-like permease